MTAEDITVTPESLLAHAEFYNLKAREEFGGDIEPNWTTPAAVKMRQWAEKMVEEREAKSLEDHRNLELGRDVYALVKIGPFPSDPEFLRALGERTRAHVTGIVAQRAAEGGAW